MITKTQIDAAAAAIANVRAGRKGVPAIGNVLELFDTFPKLRPLLAEIREDAEAALEAVGFAELREALEESVKLQSHYAGLLNIYDGGLRMRFKDADEWIARLRHVRDLKPGVKP